MATVKNVGLSPINQGDVKKYTAMQSPSYREEFYQKMRETNDVDYYLYALKEADKKGISIQDIDFNNLNDLDDQWTAFYTQAVADDIDKKDYGEVMGEQWGELTEKQYLTKLLDKKREYNVWLRQEAEIQTQKEAMSGWDKFWNGVGSWFTELSQSLEQIPLALTDFVTNWDGGDSIGFIENWRQNLIERQQDLADFERRYTNLRDVETWDPTFMGELVTGSAQTLGLMVPSIISNAVLPGSGFAVLYANVFMENVYEARHNPNVTASQAEILLRGALMAGAEAVVERIMGPSMLDNVVLYGRKFSTEIGKVTTKEGLKILLKDMVHEASEEAIQELASAMVNMTLSLGNQTWEQYNSADLAKDIGLAALMGAIFAAGNIVTGTAINDIKSGRIIRNFSRKFTAGDIISNYKTPKNKDKVNLEVNQKQEFHATNFFERIALNANMGKFSKNIQLAKEGKLSSSQKQLLYNQAMALGIIFDKTDSSQIKRSMDLLNKLEVYAKQEGVKEETIKKADNLYLSSLMMNLKITQMQASSKFWGTKLSVKEAATLAKEARISKTEGVVTNKNLAEETKKIEAKPNDPQKKARKRVVKTLVDEGKNIITTDGQKLEVLEDDVLIPKQYLEEGDPNFTIRDAIEKDLAQEFVDYMKSPKRLVGWSQAKAALIKVYPEMENYTDQQIARNLLFNLGGAYALVAALPNSDFNILFLNMLEGLKQVVYKTEVAKTVKNSIIKTLTDNFRYAARMFCAENYGVNPHDLHNVLTKEDQIFIKNERRKMEAEAAEWARTNKKIGSKQSLELSTEEFHQKYKDAQGGKGNLTVYSGTLERRGSLPEDKAAFKTLYEEAEVVEPGEFITPPKSLWTTWDPLIKTIYGPGQDIDGDRSIQWDISIRKGAPDCDFFDGNQSYVFTGVPILVESKTIDENGNIFIKGSISGETREELNRINAELEGAAFTTPEYENEGYKYMQEALLKPTLSELEKSNLTLKEVIKEPEMYLRPEIIEFIINNFGDLSKESVYMGLRSYLIGETDGTKTITVSENGDRYYFADVTPIKKFNTTRITEEVEKNPSGNTLFNKYKGKTVKASEFWKGEALIGKAADAEIEFRDGGGNFYSDEQNKIYIDTNSFLKTNQDILFALNHEFQHALQSTNRTARGFTLGAKLPRELVEEVKEMFPEAFKEGMSPEQEVKVANRIIYKYSGEMEANLHATDEEYYPFIVAIKDGHYVILTPKGKQPYNVPFVRSNKMDEDEEIKLPSSSKTKLPRAPKKDLIESTNLKYFKRPGKKLRLDPDLQSFIIEADNLNLLDEWVANKIKDGTLRKQTLMKWFKNTPNINTYTFKHLREAFWPNSPILTFDQLERVCLSLVYEVDKDGNLVTKPFVNENQEVEERPVEVIYKKGEDIFSVKEQKYRASVMEHWEGYADVKKMRRIVGATEILSRAESFSKIEEKVKNSSKDKDIDVVFGAMADFTEAILNDNPTTKKAEALREAIVKQVGAKAISGEWDYAKCKAMLDKYTIEYFEELPSEELDKLYLKQVLKNSSLKVNDTILEKAISRNRRNAIANIKRLATTIWNNTTPKNRKRLPEKIQQMFDRDGHIKTETYKGLPTSQVSGIEEQLKETALRARRGGYSSSETQKAYASVEKARKQVERLKSRSKTQVKSTTKVVTEYIKEIKTEAKVIQVDTTKKEVPKKLEKLLATNFTKKKMSQLQELENFEYYVAEKDTFRKENEELLDSITEAEWIEIVEWFEQSEFIGTESDIGLFKAIRMFTLADLVSRIKTHNIVLNDTWVNRASNIMSSNAHSSAVELSTWGKVLNSINPYRQLAEEYNVSEDTLENIQEALESDNDEKLAKAIDELKIEVAENYVEKNLMEKLIAFRYTAMLSGPVTWLRNLISNFIVKNFNKWAATIGNKLAGKRLSHYQGYKLVGTKVRTDVAEFIKLNLLDTGLLHQLTEGYSKYDPYTAETTNKVDKDYIVRTMINNFNKKFEQENVYGKGKTAKAFTKFSNFVRKMISDEKFVNEATLRYFGKMLTEDIESGRMDPNKLREGIFNKDIVIKFAEAQWLAMQDYMKNANFMTKAMSALNENEWARYIMPLLIPFAQSSWNWWVETMRYSPFGLVQSIIRLIKYDKWVDKMEAKRESSKKGQSASVQASMLDKFIATRDLGKGIIGVGIWTLGIILAAIGVVGVSKNDDEKYVIKIGDVELNVDLIFSSSSFLAGAALVGGIEQGKWWEVFNITIDQMAKTLFITDLLSSFKFQTIGDYVMELPMNILYSFVPNFIKMISQNVQVYKVKYDAGILGDLERIATGIVPGLSYAFPVEIDPYTGKRRLYKIPVLTQAGGISYNDISEEERAALAVGVRTGQLTGEITVNGEKVYMDKEKVNVYRGEFTNKYMKDLLNDQYTYNGKRYSQMDQDERYKAIRSILDKSAEYAKIKLWTENGNKYYASKDLYYTLKSLGINNVYQGSGGYIKK